jgi:CyaY protein
MISEAEYERLAPKELARLLEAIDQLDSEDVEADLESDILTIEFSSGARYVANSHRAARQIWLAAERSAWHFDWNDDQEQWVAQKSGDELWHTLERLIAKKLKAPVTLER